MRPHPLLLGAFFMVLLIGFLLAMALFAKDEGTGDYRMRAILILMITGVVSFCLLILMTSKFWFPHLWKKNSTHARHKQHSKHHPAQRDQAYRNRKGQRR